MLSSCKLKEKKKKEEKGIRAGELERMEYRYVVVGVWVCMCVLKNGETGVFSPFFFLFPSPPPPRAQCQAGHGPCRLSRHCALRFQSSPRLIPGAWTGISPRRSAGRCSPPRRSGAGGCPRAAGLARGRCPARASVPACQRSIT